jgi:hypothetical protein
MTLKQNINIDSYMMIEGDINKKLNVEYEDNTKNDIMMIVKSDLLNNESDLIMDMKLKKFKVNLRLLTLIKKTNPMIIPKILNNILKINNQNLWIE